MRPSELIYLPLRENFIPESFTFIESHVECPLYDPQVRRVFGYRDMTQIEFTNLVRKAFFFLVDALPKFYVVVTTHNAQEYQRAKDALRVSGFTDVEVQTRQDADTGDRVRDVIGYPLYQEQVNRFYVIQLELGINPTDIKQQERWNVPQLEQSH